MADIADVIGEIASWFTDAEQISSALQVSKTWNTAITGLPIWKERVCTSKCVKDISALSESAPQDWIRLYWKYVHSTQYMTYSEWFDYLLKTADLKDFKLFMRLDESFFDGPYHFGGRIILSGRIDIVDYWVTRGAPITWVMDASIRYNLENIVKLLLDTGRCDPNLIIGRDGTATSVRACYPILHHASRYGYIKIVKVLITAGADPYALSGLGESVEDIACDFYAYSDRKTRLREMLEYFATLKATHVSRLEGASPLPN